MVRPIIEADGGSAKGVDDVVDGDNVDGVDGKKGDGVSKDPRYNSECEQPAQNKYSNKWDNPVQ